MHVIVENKSVPRITTYLPYRLPSFSAQRRVTSQSTDRFASTPAGNPDAVTRTRTPSSSKSRVAAGILIKLRVLVLRCDPCYWFWDPRPFNDFVNLHENGRETKPQEINRSNNSTCRVGLLCLCVISEPLPCQKPAPQLTLSELNCRQGCCSFQRLQRMNSTLG